MGVKGRMPRRQGGVGETHTESSKEKTFALLAKQQSWIALFCSRPLVVSATVLLKCSSSGTTDYRINKGCSQICADPKVDVSQGDASTKCCTTDLCNLSGATSVKTSTAVMALGILASFFYIFRSGL